MYFLLEEVIYTSVYISQSIHDNGIATPGGLGDREGRVPPDPCTT